MGKFIVLDGLDGSGKNTQTELLSAYLKSKGKKVRVLSYPRYENISSVFVKMYLDGELGEHPEDTNAYAASTFFAVDRYLSYRMEWECDYADPDTYIIANRYTTANAVHQLSKLPEKEWDQFLSWLWDYEFGKLGIPSPDRILYLEMLPEISRRLIKKRSDETGQKIDIHESDTAFLNNSYRAALYASEKLGWTRICCYEDNEPKTRDAVHSDIVKAIGL